jgi:HPt (histidine-containing phosphotransfer) domain-containing protein
MFTSSLVREDAALVDIVTAFVEGLSDRLARMEEAVRRADYDAIRTAAHQLKGCGGGYGYPILTECAAELERHAKNRALDDCSQALEVLKGICSRVAVGPTS